MEKISFSEFMDAVKVAPITPMQALELFTLVFKYMEALHDFQKSRTPESEALARWRLRDCESAYDAMRHRLGNILPSLYYFSDSIY